MASYYYLISSLPMLKTDGTIPMSFEEFLEQCKSNVSAATYQSLCDLESPTNGHPMLKEWSRFMNALVEEATFQRKLKLGKPASPPDNRESEIANTVAAALAAKNPLISEQILLDLEFRKVDSMLGLHSFDEYFLFAYAIKLKLLERQTVFKQEDGSKEFRALFNGVKNQILSM